jgi:hypothetical protein
MTDIVEEMAKAMCEADLELVALVKRAVNVEGDSDSPIRVAAANDLYRQVDDRREQYQRAAQAAYTIVERRIGELVTTGDRYRAAVRALFAIDERTKKCFAEGSPTKNEETYRRFIELNDAGIAFSAARASLEQMSDQ